MLFGLNDFEFKHLTFAQYAELWKCYRGRVYDQSVATAALNCNYINAHSKKKVSLDQVLGPHPIFGSTKKRQTKQQIWEALQFIFPPSKAKQKPA